MKYFITFILLIIYVTLPGQNVEFKTYSAFIKNDTIWVNFETNAEQALKNFEISGKYFYDDYKVIKTVPSKAAGGNSSSLLSYSTYNLIQNHVIITASLLCSVFIFLGRGKLNYKNLPFLVILSIIVLYFCSCRPKEKADIFYHQTKDKIFVKIRCNFLNGSYKDTEPFEAIKK